MFLDDIFSDVFRDTLDKEQLVFNDNWVESIEKGLTGSNNIGGDFEIVKSGDIVEWRALIDRENPDMVLLDMYWHEQARQKYGDMRKAVDVSLDVLKGMRKTYSDLPVIQHTLKPDREIVDRSYAAGASIFLEKVPLAIAEVHSTLKYAMLHLMRNP